MGYPFNAKKEITCFELKIFYTKKIFSDNLDREEICVEHKKKLNAFYNFIDQIKTRGYELNHFNSRSVDLKGKFDKHQKLRELELLVNDFHTSIDPTEKHKKVKIYDEKIGQLKKDYGNILSLIKELKTNEDIRSHELEKLINEETNVEDKLNKSLKILELQKDKVKKAKNFSCIIKIVGGLAFIASVLELGKFYSENGEEIKNYFNNTIKPKIESIRKKPEQETIFYY